MEERAHTTTGDYLAELATRDVAHRSPASVPQQVLRREGELWTICYAGRWAQLHDVRGLHYIASMLRHAGREFHVLELVALHNDCTALSPRAVRGADLGDWLDAKAKASYKQQLVELRAELAKAKAHNDLGQIEELERQIHFFACEISRSVGLFGRSRRMNSPTERARVNVSRAIRAAISRLHLVHARAGEHFDRTIRTGTFCCYRPDPRSAHRWEV